MVIIAPYIRRVREDLGVGPDIAALAIFDHFKGLMTDKVISCLEKLNIHLILIPASCTDKLQPMDISVNRAAKAFLQNQFQDWYANEVMKQMRTNDELLPINLSSVEMKHVGAKWILAMFEHISNNPHLIVNGFVASGITDSISSAHLEADEEYDFTEDEEDRDGDMDAIFSSVDEDD